MDLIGKTLGIYKILEEIGGGGFGTVYMARHIQKNSIVAIKVLKSDLSNRSDFKQRFEEEAYLYRSLPRHANIVFLQDYGWIQNQQPYLVMDYLPGNDLRRLLENGPLPVRQAIHISAQVADALDTAARGGLIHCDIKPENLKILPDGTVMVMDFGIARAVDSSFRQIAGTPAYMAPELWRGDPPEPTTDVYALGCVCYEMFTGIQPFTSDIIDNHAKARKEIGQLHEALEPDWQQFLSDTIPGDLLILLRRMLAKSTKERPSAADVATQCWRILPNLPPNLYLSSPNQERIADQYYRDKRAGDEEDRTILKEIPDQDGTILRPLTPPPAPPPYSSTPSTPDYERLATEAQVVVQRQLASVDLGTEACRAALIQNGSLITGAIDGQIYKLDLLTGRVDHWQIFPQNKVYSPAWELAAHSNHLLVHTGDADWQEINTSNGQITRRGSFPEAGMNMLIHTGWLFLFGRRGKVFRIPLHDLNTHEEFDLGSRQTGQAIVRHGILFTPTSNGVIRLDTGSGQTKLIGPEQTARAVSLISGERLVAAYSTVSDSSRQSSIIRLINLAHPESEIQTDIIVTGQMVYPIQVTGDHIIATFRDGRVIAWEAAQVGQKIDLKHTWTQIVGAGRGLQSPPSLGAGLVAVSPSKDNNSVLVVMNISNGETVYEVPLNGEVFLSPLWWQKTLSVVIASGNIDVFRVTVVIDKPSQPPKE